MSEQSPGIQPSRAKSDFVIAVVLLLIFMGALVWSLTYPPAVAMLLPRIAIGLGVAATLWVSIGKGIRLFRANGAAESNEQRSLAEIVVATDIVGEEAQGDQVADNDAEYIFANAPRRLWLISLGFIAGFFVVMWLFGLFIAAAAFSLAYLVFVGRKRWVYAIIYTALLTGALWALMRLVTYIPSPAGILFVGG